jgi:NifB/MoaA-like Fe-S oxidoreductase
LIAPVLEGKAVELSEVLGVEVDVLSVENRFFGPTVTVSGLLIGRDVVEALRGRELGEVVFLPRAMFDYAGERTLDDMSLAEIREELGVRVEVAGTMGEVVERLWGDLRRISCCGIINQNLDLGEGNEPETCAGDA